MSNPYESNQPDPNQPYSNQPGGPTPGTGQDPGRVLGIVGLITAFTCLGVVGLVISIIGYRKSKKAGHKNTIALVGIILGAVFTVGWIIAGIVGGLGVAAVAEACQDLGTGTHQVDGVTYTCP